eukprot:12231995-Alexandrium_andersonii.AAC.1
MGPASPRLSTFHFCRLVRVAGSIRSSLAQLLVEWLGSLEMLGADLGGSAPAASHPVPSGTWE